MFTNLESFGNIISQEDELLWLVGAGISNQRPSNLPTGEDFIHSFYEFLKSKDNDLEFESSIKDLKASKLLRFEIIMSLIERHFLARTTPLLECYRQCNSYNDNHLLLAILSKLGHKIATTNFDSLLERAFLAIGMLPIAIIEDNQFQHDHSINNIYKLHGSIEKYNKNLGWLESSDSIRLTLEQVGREGYEFSISWNKRNFLVDNFKSRSLIVVGYSGYDDFDICPILLNTQSNKKLIWLDYDPNNKSIYTGKEILESPNTFGKIGELISDLIRKEQRLKDNCFIVQSGASDLLSSVLYSIEYKDPIPVSHCEEFSLEPLVYFNERFEHIFPDIDSIHRMKAVLLFQAGKYLKSLNQYKKIEKSARDMDNLYLKSKVLYEIGQCYLAIEPPDLDPALEYAKESFEIDASNQFASFLLSADLLARIYKGMEKIDLALQIYQKVLDSPITSTETFYKYQYAVLFNNYSNLLFFIGKWQDSINAARKAATLYKELGELEGIVSSSVNVSIILTESGFVDNAINELKQIEKMALELGSCERLCSLYNELGIAYRLKGELSKSIECHEKKAIEYAKKTSSKQELARQYYNIALCEWQCANYGKAQEDNLKSLSIRKELPRSFERTRAISENTQLIGNIHLVKKRYKEAIAALEESIEIAEEVQYAPVIRDSTCNLLYIAMELQDDNKVKSMTEKLKHLLLNRFDMVDRWMHIQNITQYYWATRNK
jgi:tetratricopeptide (TPR) repeat protein